MGARRAFLAALVAACLAGCAGLSGPPSPEVRKALAPTGALRVGVYAGSPTSLVKDAATGEARGVSVDIGRELARRLGVPYQQVEFPRIAAVLDAMKAGQVDFTITNATPARAADVSFTEPPLVELELGYLVLPGSKVTAVDDVDRPGINIGVTQGSTSQATLTRQYRNAAVVASPTLQAASALLAKREIDAFATNKAILFEMADGLPGARVLPGHWGFEHLAIATPKGRDAGADYLRRFARDVIDEGLVRNAAQRAGLRGIATPGS